MRPNQIHYGLAWVTLSPKPVMLTQMLIASLHFGSAIRWILDSADPPFFDLHESSEWVLMNPLFSVPVIQHDEKRAIMAVEVGEYLITSDQVFLATQNNQIIQSHKQRTAGSVKTETPEVYELAGRMLLRLRHASGQATMPKIETLQFVTFFETDSPVCVGPLPEVQGGAVQDYILRTAITAQHICAPPGHSGDFVPPTHEVLFLDAVAAYRSYDFRKAILYAAIAIEVAFGSVIDSAYAHVLAAPRDERFRVIARTQAGGAQVLKDPIYERLRGRLDFDLLINEVTLYVLQRSLLVENEALYQRAKRLNLTRNKLVHAGVLREPTTDDLLALDKNGSMAALETALDLFSWLGERADFPLPKFSFAAVGGKSSSSERS
jgi:hypothetical protein